VKIFLSDLLQYGNVATRHVFSMLLIPHSEEFDYLIVNMTNGHHSYAMTLIAACHHGLLLSARKPRQLHSHTRLKRYFLARTVRLKLALMTYKFFVSHYLPPILRSCGASLKSTLCKSSCVSLSTQTRRTGEYQNA
jgi:hypothetical protein